MHAGPASTRPFSLNSVLRLPAVEQPENADLWEWKGGGHCGPVSSYEAVVFQISERWIPILKENPHPYHWNALCLKLQIYRERRTSSCFVSSGSLLCQKGISLFWCIRIILSVVHFLSAMSWNKSNYSMASPFHSSLQLWVQLMGIKWTLAFSAIDSDPAKGLLWKKEHGCCSHGAVLSLPDEETKETSFLKGKVPSDFSGGG